MNGNKALEANKKALDAWRDSIAKQTKEIDDIVRGGLGINDAVNSAAVATTYSGIVRQMIDFHNASNAHSCDVAMDLADDCDRIEQENARLKAALDILRAVMQPLVPMCRLLGGK